MNDFDEVPDFDEDGPVEDEDSAAGMDEEEQDADKEEQNGATWAGYPLTWGDEG